MLKIDMHAHPIPKRALTRENGGTYVTTGELRRVYDDIGVEKGVILPSVAPECCYQPITNEMALEMYEAHPETFYWFCNIDPRWMHNSPDTDFSRVLSYYRELGARGVGEMTSNLYFDDPLVFNLFRHCESLNMPLTFHMGNPGYGDYGLIDEIGLPRLEKALAAFPKLTFIGHSQKFWAEIGGGLTPSERDGYPSGKVQPGGRLIALLDKYPNLRADLSAGSGSNAVMRDPEFGCAFIEKYQDRLFYGIDICDPRQRDLPMMRLSKWLDDMYADGNISKAAYEKVGRLNALSILEP